MTELKPCPFCGGEAVFYKDLDPFVNQEYAFVKCSVCGVSTPSYAMSGASVKDVAKHWNRRPEITIILDTATIAQLDEIAEYAKQRAVVKRTEQLQIDMKKWKDEKGEE